MTLHRRLKEETQQNFKYLIPYIRVQHALESMKTSADTMAGIGYAVGFQSPAAFNYAFKLITGVTPKAVSTVLKEEKTRN